MEKNSIGIDVSKDRLDVYDLGNQFWFQVDNNIRGFEKLLTYINRQDQDCFITMEATGVYYEKAAYFLNEKNVEVYVVNPYSIKQYAKMKMSTTKTDKADSKLIAMYGLNEPMLLFKGKNQTQLFIQQGNVLLEQIEDMKTKLINVLHSFKHRQLEDPTTQLVCHKIMEFLIQESKSLKKHIDIEIRDAYPRELKLLRSIPGVGFRISSTFLSLIGDGQSFETANQVARFVGLAPKISKSGQMDQKKGISKKGSGLLRKLLYMGALSASHANLPCKNMYQRMLSKNKEMRYILTSLGHKLLRQMFGVLKSGKLFDPSYTHT